MKTTLHSHMKVGVVLEMAFPGAQGGEPFLEALEKIARDDFFSLVEIGRIQEESIRRRAFGILSASRLEMGFSGAGALLRGKYDLNSFDEPRRKEAVEVAKAAYDEGREMGSHFFALLSGSNPPDRREEAMGLLIQSLREICDHAQSRDAIPIFLETFDSEIEKRCLIGPSTDALHVAREVARTYPRFQLMLDLSHLPLLKELPADSLRLLKDHLGHVHIGNCVMRDMGHRAYGDTHPPLGIPGGENDVDQVVDFLRGLFEIGYLERGRRARVTLEIKPLPGDDPDIILAGSKRALEEAWARA